jgi:hypothetical protein
MMFFEPGFIAFLMFVLLLLWAAICVRAFSLLPPLPRGVGVVAATQLITILLCELVWVIECINASELYTSHLYLPNSIAVPLIVLAYCISSIGFFTTMVWAMIKPRRSIILCFCVSIFEALAFFWSFIVIQAWASC